jgi:hypothetical protein
LEADKGKRVCLFGKGQQGEADGEVARAEMAYAIRHAKVGLGHKREKERGGGEHRASRRVHWRAYGCRRFRFE